MKRTRVKTVLGLALVSVVAVSFVETGSALAQTYSGNSNNSSYSSDESDSSDHSSSSSRRRIIAPSIGFGFGVIRDIHRQRQIDPYYQPPVEQYIPPQTYQPPKRTRPRKASKPQRTYKPRNPRILLPESLMVVSKAKPRIYSIGDKPWASDTEFLITLNPGMQPSDIADFLEEFDLAVVTQVRVGLLDQVMLKVTYPKVMSPRLALQMASDDRVFRAQPNYYYYPTANGAAQSVSLYAELQYAFDKMRLSQLNGDESGRGVKLAVIDSGISTSHPALADAVTANFTAFPDADPESLNFDHGTAVASIIAARAGMRGVAQNVSLMSAQVFRFGETGNMVADSYDIVRGIDWAVSNGAKILNLSFAGSRDKVLGAALDRASEQGVILVAAAGNEGADAPAAYPAAYDNVIAVTATDEDDGLYVFANRGEHVELAAPGVDVLVAAGEDGYGLQTGTSMATAYISGSVALMLEREPGLNVQQIKDRLAKSALDLGTAGRDPEFGFGRLDAYKAITNESDVAGQTPAEVVPDAVKVTNALDFGGTANAENAANAPKATQQ
ncbi:S8 family serine peptidase [uncultured Cohaesibacter sp.]|uniref:S8 family peptidase n=1 Tax=uncultured Cohaesibacter sp. TaxID=1002546 RepID=UPI0029C923AF|nr:S8 family serine peptidase [uncultured Cohaesibacter sp.]